MHQLYMVNERIIKKDYFSVPILLLEILVFIYPFLTYPRFFPYNSKSLFKLYFLSFKHFKLFSSSFSTFYSFIILLCESALNRTCFMFIHVLVCLLFSLNRTCFMLIHVLVCLLFSLNRTCFMFIHVLECLLFTWLESNLFHVYTCFGMSTVYLA